MHMTEYTFTHYIQVENIQDINLSKKCTCIWVYNLFNVLYYLLLIKVIMYKYIIILLNINNSYNVRVHIYYKHSAILQQNIHKQTMFRSIFDTIVGTISSMNPLTHFIRYALDKTLN